MFALCDHFLPPTPSTGRVRTHGIGGGHKQKYRMIDFQRLRYEAPDGGRPFEEKVVEVRYDPCRWDLPRLPPRMPSGQRERRSSPVSLRNKRSADIALVAGGNRKRWIIATETMQAGNIIKTSGVIGRMAGRKPPPEIFPGNRWRWRVKTCDLCSVGQWGGCIPAGGSSCGDAGQQPGGPTREGGRIHTCCRWSNHLPLRRLWEELLLQLWMCFFRNQRRFAAEGERHGDRPASVKAAGSGEGGVKESSRARPLLSWRPRCGPPQVLETCMVTVGRVSNVDHNKRVIGKAGRNRWLGIRPSSGLWQRKGGWAGRKIKPLPPMKSYVNRPSISAA